MTDLVQIQVAPDGSVEFIVEVKGGPGSGNFRHAGRPGERGGSAGGGVCCQSTGETSARCSLIPRPESRRIQCPPIEAYQRQSVLILKLPG